jgi:hypothetical protein
MAQSLPADLQRAGPLSDPVRAASGLIALCTAAGLVGAFAVRASVDAPLSWAEGLFVLSGIMTPLAMWLLVGPGRREPVLYLRAFRSDYDVNAGGVRRLLRASLGQRLRLCGIRAPQERVSWFSRLLLSAVTAYRYLGTEQFELEASDYNWMPRLLASLARARLVIIDIRDLTAHVADEIRLSHLAMDSKRCIFLTDSTRPEPAWRTFIPDARFVSRLPIRSASRCSKMHARRCLRTAGAPQPKRLLDGRINLGIGIDQRLDALQGNSHHEHRPQAGRGCRESRRHVGHDRGD